MAVLRVHFTPKMNPGVLHSLFGRSVSVDDETGVMSIWGGGFYEFDTLSRRFGWNHTHSISGVYYLRKEFATKKRPVMPSFNSNGFGVANGGIIVPANANRRTVRRFAEGHFRQTRHGWCVMVLIASNVTPKFMPMTQHDIRRFFPRGSKGPHP